MSDLTKRLQRRKDGSNGIFLRDAVLCFGSNNIFKGGSEQKKIEDRAHLYDPGKISL